MKHHRVQPAAAPYDRDEDQETGEAAREDEEVTGEQSAAPDTRLIVCQITDKRSASNLKIFPLI